MKLQVPPPRCTPTCCACSSGEPENLAKRWWEELRFTLCLFAAHQSGFDSSRHLDACGGVSERSQEATGAARPAEPPASRQERLRGIACKRASRSVGLP